MNSSFTSFETDQCELLKEVERRFSAPRSIFYLWYAPASGAFSDEDAKLLRSFEASAGITRVKGWPWFLDDERYGDVALEFEYASHSRWRSRPLIVSKDEDSQRTWRIAQPGTRVSSLSIVSDLTLNGQVPRLMSLYQARAQGRGRHAFEPFADLLLFGLLSDWLGNSSPNWLQLARGQKVPMPPIGASTEAKGGEPLPERVPAPRHSLTFTLRSSLAWPEELRS